MADAFANVAAGDPFPNSARLWNAIIDGARAKPPGTKTKRDAHRWNFNQAKIRSKNGVAVERWQPCIIETPVDPAAPWPEFTSGIPLFEAIPASSATTAAQRRHLTRLAIPLLPISGQDATRAILDGTFPAMIRMTAAAPLTRYVRPILNASPGGPFWEGHEQNLNDYQLAASAEIIWYDAAAAQTGGPAKALLRIPARPPPLWIADPAPPYNQKSIADTWTDCGPTPSAPTTAGPIVDLAAAGGFNLRGPLCYHIRAWGTWSTDQAGTGSGTPLATGSGITTAAKTWPASTVNLLLAFASSATQAAQSGNTVGGVGIPAATLVGFTTPTVSHERNFYVEAVYYAGLNPPGTVRVSLWAKQTGGSAGKIKCAAAITVFDEILHTTSGQPAF